MEDRRRIRLQALRGFVQSDPDDSFSRYALALELSSAGDDQGAREEFEELLRRDPGYTAAYHQYARLLAGGGEIAEARAMFERGIAVAGGTGDRHAAAEMQGELDELA